MLKQRKLEVGDVVQIDPEFDDVFGGCFMTVTEPKSWGAQGYVKPLKREQGLAYYRCEFENMEFVGKAIWYEK